MNNRIYFAITEERTNRFKHLASVDGKRDRRKFVSRSILLTLLLVIYRGYAFAQQADDRFSSLEKIALEEMNVTHTPGAVVAVVHNDKVVFLKAFGVSSIQSRVPVSPDMLFRIGSTTKMFTAATLVSLFEARNLRLDEPLGRYIKNFNPTLSEVTAHQLLSHTAGINAELSWDGVHDESLFAPTLRNRTDDFYITKPDSYFSYSNLGYGFAGFLIQEVSGKPYAETMNELIFKPLGMISTTFRSNFAMTYSFSQGHNFDAAARTPFVVRPVVDNVIYWPAGYLWSNANDLAQFVIAFLNDGKLRGKQVLSSDVVRKLSTPHAAIPDMIVEGSTWKYGYGLVLYSFRGVDVVEHGGDVPGYGALIRMVPAQRFAVITLTNQSGVSLNRTAETAMELMLPLKPKAENKSETAVPLNNNDIAGMSGVYVNADYRVEIFLKQDRPFFRAFGRELPITKVDMDRYSVRESDSSDIEYFVLVRSRDGQVTHLQYALRVFKKMP